jgi:hypothetical protein
MLLACVEQLVVSLTYQTRWPDIVLTRGLSTDNKVNVIIGVLTIVIGILSAILAWATLRLTGDRRRRHGHLSMSHFPTPDDRLRSEIDDDCRSPD